MRYFRHLVLPLFIWIHFVYSASPIDKWTYIEASNSHSLSFGLGAGDVTGNGKLDIVSGSAFYRNPGSDMSGQWAKVSLPNFDAHSITNVDDDGYADVIATGCNGTFWFEAEDGSGSSWKSVQIGSANPCAHNVGTAGFTIGQIAAGGKPEVLITHNGIVAYEVPTNPESGNWPSTVITTSQSNMAILLDVDDDGDNDIFSGTSSDLFWFENPGALTTGWTKHSLGQIPAGSFVKILKIMDVDNDDKPDVVVTEEQTNKSSTGLFWFKQPTDPKSPNWARTTIAMGSNFLSMDIGDIDQDGDTDIITGEALGQYRIQIWANLGNATFQENLVINSIKQPHLGCRLSDLDSDGDLDIVNISYLDPTSLFILRNDANPVHVFQSPAIVKNRKPLVLVGMGMIKIIPSNDKPYSLALFNTKGERLMQGQQRGAKSVFIGRSEVTSGLHLLRIIIENETHIEKTLLLK